MKTLVLLMVFGCVTADTGIDKKNPTTTTTTPAPPTFTVDCTSAVSATLTLIGPDKTTAEKGTCTPTQTTTKGTYTLETNCLTNGGTFIVKTIETLNNKDVVTYDKEYSVSCTDNNEPKTVTVSSILSVDANGKPVPESFTLKAPHIFMRLTKVKPDTTKITETPTTTIASLGTTIYLTIVDNSGTLKMTPLSCEATSGSSTATIWKNDNGPCIFEKSIVTKGFKDIHANSQHLMYAEIKAFRFVDAPQEDITFICKVKECAPTSSSPACPTESISSCTAGHITARRRRRDLTNSKVDEATLHHLTARLRISDHFAVHGGSGSVHYALSGVLLSVLIQIIL